MKDTISAILEIALGALVAILIVLFALLINEI
jgi:hypothetical protein